MLFLALLLDSNLKFEGIHHKVDSKSVIYANIVIFQLFSRILLFGFFFLIKKENIFSLTE